jgi:hypothetical protein
MTALHFATGSNAMRKDVRNADMNFAVLFQERAKWLARGYGVVLQ